MKESQELRLDVSPTLGQVSALLERPPNAWLLFVLAHGAGAGMRHGFLESISAALASRGVATLRYQFPYMEAGRRRPDPPAVAEAAVVAAVGWAAQVVPKLPLIAGGKSFGGRMTSGAAETGAWPEVRGLAFLGFPLHAPGQPSIHRADHLDRVRLPMLFLQGTRDEFAQLDLITAVTERLQPRATLHLVDSANHSFSVPKRSGRKASEVMDELAGTVVGWARPLVTASQQ